MIPIGFMRALSVVAVHGLTSLAAAVFGFCAVLAVRSLLRLVCGPRLFRAASPIVQFVLALALVVAFLAALESVALTGAVAYASFVVATVGASAMLALANRRAVRDRGLVFEEEPGSAQTLGLE